MKTKYHLQEGKVKGYASCEKNTKKKTVLFAELCKIYRENQNSVCKKCAKKLENSI